MSDRWPIHPKPCRGEAIDSWIGRTAERYRLRVRDLLFDISGRPLDSIDQLLLYPSPQVIKLLSEKTGVAPEDLLRMTVAGIAPQIFQAWPLRKGAFADYLRGPALLARPDALRPRPNPYWIPWVNELVFDEPRVCRACLLEDGYRRLLWHTVMTVSCPYHGALLASHRSRQSWPPDMEVDQVFLPETLADLDKKTYQSIDDGNIEFAGVKLTYRSWVRFLRLVLEELALPYRCFRSANARLVKSIWHEVGVRPINSKRLPYERLRTNQRFKYLEAASIAVSMIECGEVAVDPAFFEGLDEIQCAHDEDDIGNGRGLPLGRRRSSKIDATFLRSIN